MKRTYFVYAASGTCNSPTHSGEKVVLQYGTRRLPSDTESTATEVTSSSKTSHGSAKSLSTQLPVASLYSTAETVSKNRSTASSLQCTDWTDIEQIRYKIRPDYMHIS